MIRPSVNLLFAASLGLTGPLVARDAPAARWLVNESASMPAGLYRAIDKAPFEGAIVAVRPPPAARAYLGELGASPDALLLKRVAALPGDMVCREGRRMRWPRGAVLALAQDRQGRTLPAWQGCRRLGAEELLVLGDTAKSFDSRYFGPVARESVAGVYTEVVRW